MKIDPIETVISGNWIVVNGKVVGDANCERIEQLTSSHLVLLKTDTSGWSVLFLDPSDGAYWERLYPHAELQGGGPPRLRRLSLDEAKNKFGDWSPSETRK